MMLTKIKVIILAYSISIAFIIIAYLGILFSKRKTIDGVSTVDLSFPYPELLKLIVISGVLILELSYENLAALRQWLQTCFFFTGIFHLLLRDITLVTQEHRIHDANPRNDYWNTRYACQYFLLFATVLAIFACFLRVVEGFRWRAMPKVNRIVLVLGGVGAFLTTLVFAVEIFSVLANRKCEAFSVEYFSADVTYGWSCLMYGFFVIGWTLPWTSNNVNARVIITGGVACAVAFLILCPQIAALVMFNYQELGQNAKSPGALSACTLAVTRFHLAGLVIVAVDSLTIITCLLYCISKERRASEEPLIEPE